ncbi:MAG: hypothetical protein RSB57_09450, partial [Hungatella sp.]
AEKAMPVIDKVITKVTPAVEGVLNGIGSIADEIIPVVSEVFGELSGGAGAALPVIKRLLNGFKPMIPQLAMFGMAVFSTIQQIGTAAMPAIESIITTVQDVIPAVLPVLQTVLSTIGAVISQAAPVISGMVEGIGTVITTLAPIFKTIFSSIGEKVGSVIGFIGERVGFIQEVIGTVAPIIGSILTTAWDVISPVMDICISIFKVLFNVVQKVFPGIQSILETVWGVIKPIVEGVGSIIGKIAGGFGWIADKITGNGSEVGANAEGDNNWKGGPTWVGEKGPELVDLPRGSKILPNKESISIARGASNAAAQSSRQTVLAKKSVQRTIAIPENGAVLTVLNCINKGLASIISFFVKRATVPSAPKDRSKAGAISDVFRNRQETIANEGVSLPDQILKRLARVEEALRLPKETGRNRDAAGKCFRGAIMVSIAKLADSIIVREDADIDKISNEVAKKVIEVVVNMS